MARADYSEDMNLRDAYMLHKRQRIPKGQSNMDNPEILAT